MFLTRIPTNWLNDGQPYATVTIAPSPSCICLPFIAAYWIITIPFRAISALHSFALILELWLGTMSILGSGSSHMQGSKGVSLVFQTRKVLVIALST